jgi:glutathione S-transferase
MTLTLYTNPMSRGRIARWMLEETGAPYEAVVLGYGPPMRSPDYLVLNPMGKVPTLVHGNGVHGAGVHGVGVHGDRVVTECAAICAYLADAFPEAGLAPPPADRAAYYRWLFFGAGPVEAAVTNRSLGWDAPDARARLGYGDFASVMDTLEAAVTASPYLAGDRFSAADVYLGAQIGWGLTFGTVEDRTAFRAYWQRLETRPAFARAAALDEAAMKQAAAEAPPPEPSPG